MDYSVHGILKARILDWVAFLFSRGIFLSQGSNPDFPYCRQILYQLSHQGRSYAIHSSIYTSIPTSHSIPPPTSPFGVHMLFSMSVSIIFTKRDIRESTVSFPTLEHRVMAGHVRTQQEGNHLWPKRVPTRHQPCQHLDLGLLAFRFCEKINFCLTTQSVLLCYGFLSRLIQGFKKYHWGVSDYPVLNKRIQKCMVKSSINQKQEESLRQHGGISLQLQLKGKHMFGIVFYQCPMGSPPWTSLQGSSP